MPSGHLDEQQFAQGDVEWLIPKNLALHTIETADFYASDVNASGFGWGEDNPQTLKEMLDYAQRVQQKVRDWLARHNDEQLLSPNTVCKGTGETVLDRALYSLRHTQHHTAQINAELRRRGLPRGQWH